MGSHTEFKVKWVVTVCLGGQRPLWVRVRPDAGNMGCNAWKTLQLLINPFSPCHKKDTRSATLTFWVSKAESRMH